MYTYASDEIYRKLNLHLTEVFVSLFEVDFMGVIKFLVQVIQFIVD